MMGTLEKVSAESRVLNPAWIPQAAGNVIHLEDVKKGGTLLVPEFSASINDEIEVEVRSASGIYRYKQVITSHPVFPLKFSVPEQAFKVGQLHTGYRVTDSSGNVESAPALSYTVVP